MAAATTCSAPGRCWPRRRSRTSWPRTDIQGRVRYYGCPAEEGGSAKGFMVRAGVLRRRRCRHLLASRRLRRRERRRFRSPATRSTSASPAASAHAAAAPHLGRSALDAVELMNVGVNYMREHMPSDGPHPLRRDRCRRHRAQRGAGARRRCAIWCAPRELPELQALHRPRRQDRRGRGADDGDVGAAGRSSAAMPTWSAMRRWSSAMHRQSRSGSGRRCSTPPTAPSPPRSSRR